MILIFILLLIILFSVFIPTIVSWSVHLSMTIESCNRNKTGWGSYSEFVNLFKTCELKHDGYSSYFNTKGDSKIHASIIMFNNKGMLLNYIDWIRINIFLFNLRRKSKIKIGKFKNI